MRTRSPGRLSAPPQHAHSAGQALARLHLASQGFAAPRRKPRPLVASFTIFAARDPGVEIERYLAARPVAGLECRCARQLQAGARNCLRRFMRSFSRFCPLCRRCGRTTICTPPICSGAMHSANAQATAIIDFGLADRTNAVHDLANAIERNIVEWLVLVADPAHPDDVPVHLDHLHALLDGYESVRPLSRKRPRRSRP